MSPPPPGRSTARHLWADRPASSPYPHASRIDAATPLVVALAVMTFDTSALATEAMRLVLALLLGSAIGIERQWAQKMAGLRTNALVALGAAGFVLFSGLMGHGDPTRVAAQVVSGIGF